MNHNNCVISHHKEVYISKSPLGYKVELSHPGLHGYRFYYYLVTGSAFLLVINVSEIVGDGPLFL
jgi:hypothetical protein